MPTELASPLSPDTPTGLILSLQDLPCWPYCLRPLYPSPWSPASSPGPGRRGSPQPCWHSICAPSPSHLALAPVCSQPHSFIVLSHIHMPTYPSVHHRDLGHTRVPGAVMGESCPWRGTPRLEASLKERSFLQVRGSSGPLRQGLPPTQAPGRSPHLCYPIAANFTLCCSRYSLSCLPRWAGTPFTP